MLPKEHFQKASHAEAGMGLLWKSVPCKPGCGSTQGEVKMAKRSEWQSQYKGMCPIWPSEWARGLCSGVQRMFQDWWRQAAAHCHLYPLLWGCGLPSTAQLCTQWCWRSYDGRNPGGSWCQWGTSCDCSQGEVKRHLVKVSDEVVCGKKIPEIVYFMVIKECKSPQRWVSSLCHISSDF